MAYNYAGRKENAAAFYGVFTLAASRHYFILNPIILLRK